MANEYEMFKHKNVVNKEKVKEWLENKNNENLNNIILQYHYFVKWIVGKLIKKYNCPELFDDFMQDAQIPLIKTYWDYDFDKKADFTTILKIRIEGYIQQMYNNNYRTIAVPKHAFKEKKIKSISILMNDYIDIEEENIKNDLSYEIDYDKTNEIQKILKTFLSDKQFFIISNAYGFNMKKKKSATEIGKYLNCSRQQIEKEIKKIKQLIAENKSKFIGEC